MTKALQYVEIDLDHCSLTYSVAPCQASLTNSPPTGTKKCFNTPATCQDRQNYTNVPITMRFAVPTDYLPSTIEAIPNIKEISFSPGLVSLGENLGQRSALTITFTDHRHSDTGAGGDKYLVDRAYNPYKQGTFLAKFRARNKFLSGRPLRWINGTLGQALAAMETHHYIIDSYSGPDGNGEYTITAKDILRLADGDKSLAPATSVGSINAAITNVDTAVTLKPAGASVSYPGGGYVTLGGSEIAQYAHQSGYVGDSPAGGPNAATLGGSTSGRQLTGFISPTDSTRFTVNFWYKPRAALAGRVLLTFVTGTFAVVNQFVTIQFDASTSKLRVVGKNSGGTTILDVQSLTTLPQLIWSNVLMSFDLSSSPGATGKIYLNDIDDTGAFAALQAGTLKFTGSGGSAACDAAAGNLLNGDIADLWLNQGTYFDLTIAANRRNFVTSDRRPVVLGSTGQNPTGSTPFIYMGNAGSSWFTNLGTGGGFTTVVGSPTSATFSDGESLNLIARGQLGTTAASHAIDERVQLVLQYTAQDPAIIISDLLTTYADIPSAFVPLSAWLTETQTYLGQLYSAVIPAPTAVADLISELILQAGLVIWWNDDDQTVGLAVIRGAVSGAQVFNTDNTIAGSLSIADQPDKRLSQIHTYFGQINPLGSLTDTANFKSLSLATATQAETDYGSASIKEIFSRWIPIGGKAIADKLNLLLLQRYQDPPRHFKFQQFRNTSAVPELARTYNLSGWPLQTDEGALATAQMQITRVKPMADLIEIEGEELLFTATDTTIRNVTFDVATNDVNARTRHDALYSPPSSGNTVNLAVAGGVIIGSTSATTPAFNIGTWPAGVTVTLTVYGRIQGHGGNGGDDSGGAGLPGQQGGTALFTRQAITMTDATGAIWGGGGGGGGGSGQSPGGSGGAGTLPGVGGAGFGSPSGNTGTDTAGGAAVPPLGGTGGVFGGAGGAPGLAGGAAPIGGTGGAAGNAIDGISFVTTSGGSGDRRGGQIN